MPIEAFIYDFDGTLSDSYPIFLKILKDLMREHGGTSVYSDAELYRRLKEWVIEGYSAVEWEEGFTMDQYKQEFLDLQAAYANDFCLYPNAKEILEAAIAKGKKNYLYTHSGKVVYSIMENMGILHCFTHILDASHGFPKKPAPDALLHLIDLFSLDPAQCVMIGDRPIDVGAGANAGMQSCLFDPDGFYPDTPATYHVDELKDIINLIEA